MADTEDKVPDPAAIEPNPAETIATKLPTKSMDEPEEPEVVAAEETPVEEPDADPDAPAELEKAKPKLDWKDQRRIEETNKRRAAEAERDRLKAEIETLRKGTPLETPSADQPITREEARRLARLDLEAEGRANAFKEATGRVLQEGLKSIPDFEDARQEMVANFGDQLNARPDFFEAITDTDIPNGHDVFYHLAKDPEQTERLLGMPPSKMAIQIAKLSEKLAKPAEAAAVPQKKISGAPPPVKPINANPTVTNRLDDANLPMDQFADTFLKGLKKKFG